MRFQEKLKRQSREALWAEYCGFLDLSMDQYMQIQRRLMQEQLALWSASGLGQALMGKRQAQSVEEFRQVFPLTRYEDYADHLLAKREDILPDKPVIWIQTTWEGGKHPIKLAPYTPGMLRTFTNNLLACMMLFTSRGRGHFDIDPKGTFLYGLAPLPYATGLVPHVLQQEIDIEFLPSPQQAEKLSFSERNKLGFRLGLQKGIDYFFGLGSVAYCVSLALGQMKGKSGGENAPRPRVSPRMMLRYLRGKYRARREERALRPADLFALKGFMVAGTDNRCYKDELTALWGVRPLELFAGTEPTCIGTETWARDGMYFFPDACFYEFIPQRELDREEEDPAHVPLTCLMDEVVAGETYELVISVFKGGAFMRYRVGDMYRCLSRENPAQGTRIPQFAYLDRTVDMIDVAGFTRISASAIDQVIALSGLAVVHWAAAKEYDQAGHPLMHLYVEMRPEALANQAVSSDILRDHLSIYFKFTDQDYKNLKKLLGMDPLQITILRCGSFAAFQRLHGRPIRRMNPPRQDITLLSSADPARFVHIATEVDDA